MVGTRVVVFTAFALALVAPAWAQDLPPTLTLQHALQLAASRNPTLAAAGNDVEMVEADRLQATRRLNPLLSVGSEGLPPPPPRPSFFNGQEIIVRVDQEIETAGKRRLRSETAAAATEVVRSRLADERRRLDLEVQRAYFQIVLAKADREVARASLEDIDRMLVLTKARLDQGEIAGGELRRLQVERLRFADDQFATELAFKNATSALLAVMGFTELSREFDVSGTLADPLPPVAALAVSPAGTALDRGVVERQALTLRPDLAAAQRDERRADTEILLQRAFRTPNLIVGGGYKRTLTLNGVVFGFSVPLPFFDRNPGGIARAEAERRQAANVSLATELTIRLEVQQAINAIEINQARVRYIEQDTLTNAREARDAVMAAYQVGEAGLIDYLDAQRSFRETLRIYNRALYERRISDFELAAAVGGPSVQP